MSDRTNREKAEDDRAAALHLESDRLSSKAYETAVHERNLPKAIELNQQARALAQTERQRKNLDGVIERQQKMLAEDSK